MLPELARRLHGSSDLFEHNGRHADASINFVACHDGMTLRDLVSYGQRYNLANGEDNRDGHHNDHSDNCGVEGPSDDEKINALRDRQRRNLLATLYLSQGVPMLSMGDEQGRTQGGNNNAYCQDNETSWLSWNAFFNGNRDLIDFVARLSNLRRRYPVLRTSRFKHGDQKCLQTGFNDIHWYAPHGDHMNDQDWENPEARCLGLLLVDGDESRDVLLLLLNADRQPTEFTLPVPPLSQLTPNRNLLCDSFWRCLLDTSRAENSEPDFHVDAGHCFTLPERSVLLFKLD